MSVCKSGMMIYRLILHLEDSLKDMEFHLLYMEYHRIPAPCFYHLLSSDQQRPVALVESEKSALISSFYLPQYLWIASGGKNGAFNRDAMSVLRNRRVLLFPDLGATDYWNSKMEIIRSLGIEVSLFDFMERNATKEERDAGYDIADFLLREETKEAIFNRLIVLNPALKTLVETFDLQLVNVEKAPLSATVQHTRRGLFKQ